MAFGYTIFCDDVRMELGNKVSFMGIYNDAIVVDGNFPITVPKFCVIPYWVEQYDIAHQLTKPIRFRVFLPGDKPNEPTGFSFDIDPKTFGPPEKRDYGDPDIQHTVRLSAPAIFQPLVLSMPGHIKVRVFVGNEVTRCGSLTVVARSSTAMNFPQG